VLCQAWYRVQALWSGQVWRPTAVAIRWQWRSALEVKGDTHRRAMGMRDGHTDAAADLVYWWHAATAATVPSGAPQQRGTSVGVGRADLLAHSASRGCPPQTTFREETNGRERRVLLQDSPDPGDALVRRWSGGGEGGGSRYAVLLLVACWTTVHNSKSNCSVGAGNCARLRTTVELEERRAGSCLLPARTSSGTAHTELTPHSPHSTLL